MRSQLVTALPIPDSGNPPRAVAGSNSWSSPHFNNPTLVANAGVEIRSVSPYIAVGVPTRTGETHRYVLQYAAPPRISGAFGYGDRLLSYAAPAAARTELAPAETAVTIVIVYGATIAPETFRATLAGRDVSARFKPAPGRVEAVRLSIAAGSSTLVLSIRGATAEGRTIVHTDQLELVRP